MKTFTLLISLFFIGFAQNVNAQEAEPPTVFKWFQVQEKAKFPGGNDALDQFIKDNIVIPNKAYKKAKSGTVLVSFIVEKDGSLSNIKIVSKKKLGYGIEKACIKVIKKMPNWIPAVQRDQPCRMAFTKPIRMKFT